METPLAPSSPFSSKQLLAVASELYPRPLASILLIRSAWAGAGLWILLLQEPRLAVVAFLALSVIEAIGQVMARGDGTVFGAMTRANALLCSLAMAWLLAPMELLFLLELVLVFAALCVGLYFTLIFMRLLRDSLLPPVIWPYSLLAAISVTLFPFGVPDAMVHFGWPVVLDWTSVYVEAAQAVVAGDWQPQQRWSGLATGVVTMAPYNTAIPDEVRAELEQTEADIASGALHPFAGELRDQQGDPRVAAGEVLTEADIRAMDGFVEGMIGTMN